MAYGYWKQGKSDQVAAFHLFFRKTPFRGGYAVSAGLETACDLIESFRFGDDDIDYLASLTGNDKEPLFEPEFLDHLSRLTLSIDIDAIAEGTVVFPHEPLLRVTGPILQCQLLETALLNIINFQTLIATKAARVVSAAGDDDVLEFGLRRAQGIDGALSASRAAYIGGCAATSNVLAGKQFGIPVKGTHAHSWIMSFESEPEAMLAYAEAMPNNCVFLVDTYDTLEGVGHAIETGKWLRKRGHRMVGIRLDSGDLAWLSIEARRLLDDAGFEDAVIVASNDLDEHLIESLKHQKAAISVWGVGTKLVTAYDQPALGGVYKLAAIKDRDGRWQPKIKVSEQTIKTSIPGILQVRRYYDSNQNAVVDMIFNELQSPTQSTAIVDFYDPTHQTETASMPCFEDLLKPVIRNGKPTGVAPSLSQIRDRTKLQLQKFDDTVLRFENPHKHRVGLESGLYDLRYQMVVAARQSSSTKIGHDRQE